MIPAVIVEEHHEALFAWYQYFQSPNSNETDLMLLHFDQHADMELPVSAEPIRQLSGQETKVLTHVREVFSIDNFVLAGVFLEYFSHIVWYCRNHPTLPEDQSRFVATAGPDDVHLISGTVGPDTVAQVGSTFRPYSYREASLAGLKLKTLDLERRRVLLDIDLDYFSSARWPAPAFTQLEIPEKTFDEIQSDPYHFLRLLVGPALKYQEEDGRYFVTFHKHDELPPSPFRRSREDITSSIEELAAALSESGVEPLLITIARSHYSGYTPPEDIEWIEEQLLKRLGSLYPIEVTVVSNPV
jgi:hypothetical protein